MKIQDTKDFILTADCIKNTKWNFQENGKQWSTDIQRKHNFHKKSKLIKETHSCFDAIEVKLLVGVRKQDFWAGLGV